MGTEHFPRVVNKSVMDGTLFKQHMYGRLQVWIIVDGTRQSTRKDANDDTALVAEATGNEIPTVV